MAETEAQIGYGTLLKLGNDASPQTYTTIAEVKSIDGFGFTLAEVDATHMESPGAYVERVAGLKDGDTMTALLNMIRSNALITKAVWDAAVRRDFELNFPSTLPDYDFSAVPTGWHVRGVTPGGVLEVEVTMRISGAIIGS
jgi:predicted secreted protein